MTEGHATRQGAALEITVPKSEYFAGETIAGVVKFIAADGEWTVADTLTVSVSATEVISWTQKQAGRARLRKFENRVVVAEDKKEAKLNVQSGEHEFNISLELPKDLSSTYMLERSKMGHLGEFKSSVAYRIEAAMEGSKGLPANVGREIHVQVLPNATKEEEAKCVHDTVIRPLGLVSALSSGKCRVSGTSISRAVNLVTGAVRVHASVRNDSYKSITSVYLRIYEDVAIHVPGTKIKHRIKRRIYGEEFNGIEPWGSRGDIVVEFTMKELLAGKIDNVGVDAAKEAEKAAPLTLLPTMDTKCITIGYHITIGARYAWRPDIQLHLPLILRADIGDVPELLLAKKFTESREETIEPVALSEIQKEQLKHVDPVAPEDVNIGDEEEAPGLESKDN